MNLLTLLIFFEESGLTQKSAPPVLADVKKFHELGLKIPDKLR